MLVSICIPMYNESQICGLCSSALADFSNKISAEHEIDIEIIYCSDGSTDNTVDVLEKHIADNGYLNQFVYSYDDNRGKGGALKEAVSHSKGDIVLYTDADLAYGTDYIPDFISAIKSGADMAVGTRRLNKDGYGEYTFVRRLMSKMYIAVLHAVAGFNLSDSQCGIKALKGDYARKIFKELESNGFSFDLEVILRAQNMNLVLKEIPVKVVNHRTSTSKVRPFHDAFKMLRDVRRIKKTIKALPKE